MVAGESEGGGEHGVGLELASRAWSSRVWGRAARREEREEEGGGGRWMCGVRGACGAGDSERRGGFGSF